MGSRVGLDAVAETEKIPTPTRSLATILNELSWLTNEINLDLCLTKYHAMKTYWGSECVAVRILNLGTRSR
jgi:hypothetical protein